MNTAPAADYDSPWKVALALYLPDAFALFLPQVYAQIEWARGYTLLDKELQKVTRDAALGRRLADTLVKVWRTDHTEVWVLIHVEMQGTRDPQFAKRMFVYHYRMFDRHDRPVLSVGILADAEARWRPARFRQELWGCGVEFHYPVVKLLDWRARDAELAASRNPFAVVVRAHLAAQATRQTMAGRVQARIGLLRGLRRLGHTEEQIQELLRLIDWLLVLPEELEAVVEREIEALEEGEQMAYVTSWERLGMARGKAEGKAEGRAEGVLTGQRAMLRRLIEARFGAVPEHLEEWIAGADQQALEHLADRVATAATLDETLTD
jgi:hypothetical protein